MSQTSKTKTETKDVSAEDATNAASVKNEELGQETDELLDEIDSVLEANAAQFVADYIQKGGQ